MTVSDAYYRAMLAFRKQTEGSKECAVRREAFRKADAGKDRLLVTRMRCEVDEDWVCEIEKGLPFLERALAENRQFILSNGETEPIERVKHVSKESVEHLARHSNYITRYEEGEDVVPDRLYTVERLNDYAVYENRFLYLVLCLVRDFAGLRYDKLRELSTCYEGKLFLEKTVNVGKQRLEYRLSIDDVREDDAYLAAHDPIGKTLDRIDAILRSVAYYLRTPLMLEVAKADKLRPPIAKTNVLRMDKNFKGVVALYEYLVSYEKQGYSAVAEERCLTPFSPAVGDEFAEIALASAFLAYEHGLGLEAELGAEFQKEEERRKQEREKRLTERLQALRRRIAEEGGSPEEYLLLLERRNAALEADREELLVCRAENERLRREAETLNEGLSRHRAEIGELNERHGAEMAELGAQLEELAQKSAREREESRAAMQSAEEEFYRRLSAREEESRTALAERDAELSALRAELSALREAKTLSDGRLNALRYRYGLTSELDDFTSEESFDELERQYISFRLLFKGQWKQAKRRIRREYLKASFSRIGEQLKTAFRLRPAPAGNASQERETAEAVPEEQGPANALNGADGAEEESAETVPEETDAPGGKDEETR